MQFHVLVHCAEGEGAVEKIRQLLASIRITPDLLYRSGPDKALLIKRPFNQTQAASLRTQLRNHGFESSILSRSQLQKASTASRPGKKAAASASPALSRFNQPIESLFKTPAEGIGGSQFSSLSAWLISSRILAKPIADIALLMLVCLLPPLAAAWLMTVLADLSIMLGLLAMPVFFVAIAKSSALLAFFLWPRQAKPPPRLLLNSDDDPRLLLFAAKVSRLVGAPAPASIWLTMAGRPHLGLEQSSKGSLALELPLPLLHKVSLAELAGMLAGEALRFSPRTSAKPLHLVERLRQRLRTYGEASLDLRRLEQAEHELSSATIAGILHRAASILRAAENWRAARALKHLQRIDRLLANNSSSKHVSGLFWGGSTQELEKQIEQLKRNMASHVQHAVAHADFLLVDQAAAAIAAQSQLSSGPAPDAAIVRDKLSARNLVQNLEQYDQRLSRRFYQHHGLDLKHFRLLPRDEIIRERQLHNALQQMASQYFCGWQRPRQYWQIPALDVTLTSSPNAMRRQLNGCIRQLRHLAPERQELIARQERLQQQLAELRAARKVSASGGSFKLVHSSGVSPDSLSAKQAVEVRLREYNEELFHQNSIMGERLALSLALAQQRGIETRAMMDALSCLANLRPRVEQLQLDLSEWRLLTSSKIGGANASLSLHQRELGRAVDSSYQRLARQLHGCPYDFCDPALANLGLLFQLRTQQNRPHHRGDKAELLLAVIDEAQEKINQRAVGIAAKIEQYYQIEKIRRIDTVSAEARETGSPAAF